MEVRVVYHDSVKDLIGTNVEVLYLDDSATAASLLSRLSASHPGALSQVGSLQLARGGQTITQDAFLQDGDIIDVCIDQQRSA